jgi:hypothetical protein
MTKPQPITITLDPREVGTLTGVFELFSKTMAHLEIDVPPELKRDMATILSKMVDALTDQIVTNAMEN